MTLAKMTLLGMYNFDNTLFDNLTLPEGVDRDTLIDNILVESAEFSVLYSDLEFLKSYIGVWARKWQRTFEKWIAALNIDYNPLENYDRIESWNDSGNNSGSVSSSGETSGEMLNKVSAFDSPTLQNDTSSENSSQSSDNSENSSEYASEHEGRVHGNIGVTTSQQMLQSELDIARFNLIQQITDIFIKEMCVMVY